jgi:hypothetical protein
MVQRSAVLVQDVLIVWGDHDQLFPLEKAFAVQRYSDDDFRAHAVQFLFFFSLFPKPMGAGRY